MKGVSCFVIRVLLAAIVAGVSNAEAACTSPVGSAGAITWNGTSAIIWCDGSNWNSLAPSGGSLSGGTSGYLGVWTGAASLGLSSTSAGQQLFWDGTNHRLGIGTTTPDAKLTVNGASHLGNDVRLTRTDGFATASLVVDNATTTKIALQKSGGGNIGNIDLLADTTYLSGNVGVGTTTPSLGLTVEKDNGNGWVSWFGNSSSSDRVGLGVRTARASIQGFTSAGAAANLTLQPDGGNVGIGTLSPGFKLDVFGHIRASEGEVISSRDTPEGGALSLYNPGKSGATAIEWKLFNMTGSYGNGLSFWRYYANGTNAGPAMFIGDSGNVGIGTAAPGYSLDINGTVRAVGYQYASDRRLKSDIKTVDGLNIVTRLRGVSFRWKKTGVAATGVIAQEVEEVLPAAVGTDDHGIKSVDYLQIIGPMIEAIKEIKADNDNLRAINDNQSDKIDQLRFEVETLKRLAGDAH